MNDFRRLCRKIDYVMKITNEAVGTFASSLKVIPVANNRELP